MKIGILTLPLHTNYGGILQAYALQTVLERMGHEVEVIGVRHKITSPRFLSNFLYFSKRIIKKLFINHKININNRKYLQKCLPTVCQYTWAFIGKYIHERKLDDVKQIATNDYDVFIVGSDQVWRPLYYPQLENAYLDFTNGWNVKRISYAASLGSSKWEYSNEQTKSCKSLVQQFNAISVREADAVELLKTHLEVVPEHVLDPTLLLTAEDYSKLFTKREDSRILNYILDYTESKKTIIKGIEDKELLSSYRINSRFEEYDAPIEERIQPPVEDWLSNIASARIVITDSFHACVFAIIFHKPFVVLANPERGLSRISSLLCQLNLNDRLIGSVEEYEELNNIDWTTVDNLLSEKRNHSMEFLNKAINE